MRSERVEYDLGERHRASGCLRFGRPELRAAAVDCDDLLFDVEGSAQEIDGTRRDGECLTLAESCSRGRDDERSVLVGDSVDERRDLGRVERHDSAAFAFRQLDPDAWRGGDESARLRLVQPEIIDVGAHEHRDLDDLQLDPLDLRLYPFDPRVAS